jgi:hypothetical protein
LRRVLIGLTALAVLLVAVPAFAGGQSDLAKARQATARFHQVESAGDAGYGSTLDDLGCFENPGVGGMGLHYLNVDHLMDGVPDAVQPEALVYEMRENGQLKLVALEYIVPTDLWTGIRPPSLYGREFHRHPVLPLWVLHAWIWEPNPLGMFEDWNPNVAMCPEGVPIFGE